MHIFIFTFNDHLLSLTLNHVRVNLIIHLLLFYYKHMLTVVQHNNMEAVHQLSLVLMDPLHLDIKY